MRPVTSGVRTGRWSRVLALVACLGLASCASSTPGPSVTLASVTLTELGLLEQRFVTTIRILNPSNVELALEGVSLEIELNGDTFAHGVSPVSVVIPGYGNDTVRVETFSSTTAVIRQFRRLATQGEPKVQYRLKGRLHPRDHLPAIPFQDGGVISLTDLGGG